MFKLFYSVIVLFSAITFANDSINEACANNDYEACFKLGNEYVSTDKFKAGKFFYKSCALGEGNLEACSKINFKKESIALFAKGLALADKEDEVDEGIALISKSCDMNYNKACFALSFIFKGDIEKSFYYLEKACNSYLLQGCSVLADFYSKPQYSKLEKANEFSLKYEELQKEK